MAAVGAKACSEVGAVGERTGPGAVADDHTGRDVAQQEHPHRGEQQDAGDHEEAGVAEGELEADAQPGLA